MQGREFGVGVVLASQYLSHFKRNGTDYREPLLTWFLHKVPNVRAAELNQLGMTTDAAAMADRIRELKMHECVYKTHDGKGTVVRGKPFYEVVPESEGAQ